jgi:hypothetical protein
VVADVAGDPAEPGGVLVGDRFDAAARVPQEQPGRGEHGHVIHLTAATTIPTHTATTAQVIATSITSPSS